MHFKSFRNKLKTLAVVCILPAFVIAAKLFYLQILLHDKFKDRSSQAVETLFKKQTLRGTIYDRNFQILAKSMPTYQCAISKKYVNKPTELQKILSDLLGIESNQIFDKWEKNGNFFYLTHRIFPDTADELKKALEEKEITGVTLNPQNTRFYPNDHMAIDLLGAVNSKNKGVSGLELLYENILGEEYSEKSYALKDKYGSLIYDSVSKEDPTPLDVHLTIDARAQFIAEKAIDDAVTKNKAKGGFIIVQDPNSGEILASASNPRESGKAYLFQWTYEPGSTFKVVTVSAGLDSGIIKEHDVFYCEEGSWQFSPSVTIGDHKEHGILDTSQIIEVSSNIGAGKIALKIPPGELYKYIRAFGFGAKTAIGYPGQSKGVMISFKKWKPLDIAVMGFGHALSVTGVQLIGAFTTIANGGKLLEPQILKKITDTDGNIKYQMSTSPIRQVISGETAKKINKMMQAVVETGTAMSAYIEGYTVAGKTGTSRKIDKSGEYTSEKHTSSFCGFLPATNPKFTILVVIDQPLTSSYGGVTAAPVFKEVARKLISLYGVKPDDKSKYRSI